MATVINPPLHHALPRLQDSIADKAMHHLLLYDLAECAAALDAAAEQHNKQQDRSEPHHVQLLQQLGLGGLVLEADRGIQSSRTMYAVHHMITASMVISNGLQQLPAAAGADCSSSSTCGPLEAAAMLTLMQCMLLPPPGNAAAWFHNTTHMLCCFLDGVTASARTAAAAVMLKTFVTQLLPAGLSALTTAAAAAAIAPDSSSSSTAAALQPQTSSAAVTTPMPPQPSVAAAARVLNLWLSTGEHYYYSIDCMPQHLVLE
jgi:hypothetical protein